MTAKSAIQTDQAEEALKTWGEQQREKADSLRAEAAQHDKEADTLRVQADEAAGLYEQSQEALRDLAAHRREHVGKKAKG